MVSISNVHLSVLSHVLWLNQNKRLHNIVTIFTQFGKAQLFFKCCFKKNISPVEAFPTVDVSLQSLLTEKSADWHRSQALETGSAPTIES